MAEQTYDLTQTGAEVQAIINDANNVKGAGAQTTLTDESVLLKDTNGQYHKILKSSFTEAIRDTLAGLLVNNDKGTTINQIAAIASGDFGSVTPANLASVLGVVRNTGINVTDANTTTAIGTYFTNPSSANLPVTNRYGYLKVEDFSGYSVQTWIDMNLNQYYQRARNKGVSPADFSNSAWTLVIPPYIHDNPTLSSLASALGASKMKSLLNNSSSAIHRKLVFSNYENYKSYATIYYSRFGGSTAIYNVFRTLNSSWLLTPIVENSQQPITDINDIVIDSYSSLTVTAFNCDVSIDAIS